MRPCLQEWVSADTLSDPSIPLPVRLFIGPMQQFPAKMSAHNRFRLGNPMTFWTSESVAGLSLTPLVLRVTQRGKP